MVNHTRPTHGRRETDLDAPVRAYLEARGYTVRSEVLDCDLTATLDGDLVVVELKRGLTIDLLLQATQRQRLTDSVYVAVPRTDWMGRGKRWRAMAHLLKRLELGLLLVAFGGGAPRVEAAFHPVPFVRRRQPAAKRAVLREAAARSGDYNQGGSTGRPLVTAYRENALRIARCLEEGPLSPKALRARGTGPKTTNILHANHYGWFARVDRALYALTAEGHAALKAYADVLARLHPAPEAE